MAVILWRDEMSPLVSWRPREAIGTSLPTSQLGLRRRGEIKGIRASTSSPETSMALVMGRTHGAGPSGTTALENASGMMILGRIAGCMRE